MLNYDGISKVTATAPTQILANVELQESVGCIVPTSLGTAVDGKKIAKAGTPIHIDLSNLQTPAAAGSSSSAANAVLLHDVDVTNGSHNGTALIFGFVNINRLDSDVQAKVTAGINAVGAVSFFKA